MSVRALLVRVAVVVFAASILTSAVAGYIVKTSLADSRAAGERRIFAAQVKACARQNVRTQGANTNAMNTWSVDTLFASALTHPEPNQPPQSAAQKQLVADFRARLLDTVASLTWTPINAACGTFPAAVQLPVAFEKQLPSNADITPAGQKRLRKIKAGQ